MISQTYFKIYTKMHLQWPYQLPDVNRTGSEESTCTSRRTCIQRSFEYSAWMNGPRYLYKCLTSCWILQKGTQCFYSVKRRLYKRSMKKESIYRHIQVEFCKNLFFTYPSSVISWSHDTPVNLIVWGLNVLPSYHLPTVLTIQPSNTNWKMVK